LTVRISASISVVFSNDSSSASASTRKNSPSSMYLPMRARFLPSTSTFTVPSGKRRSWTTVPSVPTR
jgi:hypothetical protein